ncbi:MAG: hypothetical protein HC831_10565 [Chloroflexia bacterium]|nr:hypothetical protein [Chloroflexia bacterium]
MSFYCFREKDKTILDACFKGLEELPVFTDKKGGKYQGVISTDEYETPVELMRFFTSFGVSHFNRLREINNYNWRIQWFISRKLPS